MNDATRRGFMPGTSQADEAEDAAPQPGAEATAEGDILRLRQLFNIIYARLPGGTTGVWELFEESTEVCDHLTAQVGNLRLSGADEAAALRERLAAVTAAWRKHHLGTIPYMTGDHYGAVEREQYDKFASACASCRALARAALDAKPQSSGAAERKEAE